MPCAAAGAGAAPGRAAAARCWPRTASSASRPPARWREIAALWSASCRRRCSALPAARAGRGDARRHPDAAAVPAAAVGPARRRLASPPTSAPAGGATAVRPGRLGPRRDRRAARRSPPRSAARRRRALGAARCRSCSGRCLFVVLAARRARGWWLLFCASPRRRRPRQPRRRRRCVEPPPTSQPPRRRPTGDRATTGARRRCRSARPDARRRQPAPARVAPARRAASPPVPAPTGAGDRPPEPAPAGRLPASAPAPPSPRPPVTPEPRLRSPSRSRSSRRPAPRFRIDREMTTGMALSFEVVPEDALIKVPAIGERRWTSIGRAGSRRKGTRERPTACPRPGRPPGQHHYDGAKHVHPPRRGRAARDAIVLNLRRQPANAGRGAEPSSRAPLSTAPPRMVGAPRLPGPVDRRAALPTASRSPWSHNPQAPLVTTASGTASARATSRPAHGGVAHFLEHMMFKGSARFGPGEIDRRTQALGGANNAFTRHDSPPTTSQFASDRWQQALDIEPTACAALLLDPAEVDERAPGDPRRARDVRGRSLGRARAAVLARALRRSSVRRARCSGTRGDSLARSGRASCARSTALLPARRTPCWWSAATSAPARWTRWRAPSATCRRGRGRPAPSAAARRRRAADGAPRLERRQGEVRAAAAGRCRRRPRGDPAFAALRLLVTVLGGGRASRLAPRPGRRGPALLVGCRPICSRPSCPAR